MIILLPTTWRRIAGCLIVSIMCLGAGIFGNDNWRLIEILVGLIFAGVAYWLYTKREDGK